MVKQINKPLFYKKLNQKNIWNCENIYHLKTDISRMSNLIYHYEIYKKIVSLPGDVVECGVFKGSSLIRFLTFREILENYNSRKIYGFDVFGKFPKAKNKADKSFLKGFEKNAGDGIDVKELNDILSEKKFSNFELIKGDVKKTISKLLKRHPSFKISLLHLDMDIYEPTKFSLNKFFPYVVKGGIILIDDYNMVYGATKVIDEFLSLNKDLVIKKLSFNKKPSYIIKN
jgi:hypothetical protein